LSFVDFEVPEIVADGDVAPAPEKQGDVDQNRTQKGRPQPRVDRENSVHYVLLAYPAPVLANTALEGCKQEAQTAYRSWSEKNVGCGSMSGANRSKVDDGEYPREADGDTR
jgi:hypothetical protein